MKKLDYYKPLELKLNPWINDVTIELQVSSLWEKIKGVVCGTKVSITFQVEAVNNGVFEIMHLGTSDIVGKTLQTYNIDSITFKVPIGAKNLQIIKLTPNSGKGYSSEIYLKRLFVRDTRQQELTVT